MKEPKLFCGSDGAMFTTQGPQKSLYASIWLLDQKLKPEGLAECLRTHGGGTSWNWKPDLQFPASRFLLRPLCMHQFKCTCLCSWLKLIIILKAQVEFLTTCFLSSDSVSDLYLNRILTWSVSTFVGYQSTWPRSCFRTELSSLTRCRCWHLAASGWLPFWELPWQNRISLPKVVSPS